MKPSEQAAKIYDSEPCARSFAEDLEAHLLNGYVISTPTAFILAREVPSTADHAEIVNPWITFEPSECDTWMIYLAAGEFAEFWQHCPHEHKFFAWERKNVLRFSGYQEIEKRCKLNLLSGLTSTPI